MVGKVGLEPTWLLPARFKRAAYTNSATPPLIWCPHEDLNLGLLITSQLLYHLTIRARTGANSRTRTDDIKLGRLLLYQLSYVRMIGGECRIRTHGASTGTDAFKAPAIDHSANSPLFWLWSLGSNQGLIG